MKSKTSVGVVTYAVGYNATPMCNHLPLRGDIFAHQSRDDIQEITKPSASEG